MCRRMSEKWKGRHNCVSRYLLVVVLMLQKGLVLRCRCSKIEARRSHERRHAVADGGSSARGHGRKGGSGSHLHLHPWRSHREGSCVGASPCVLRHGSHIEGHALAHDRRIVERTATACSHDAIHQPHHGQSSARFGRTRNVRGLGGIHHGARLRARWLAGFSRYVLGHCRRLLGLGLRRRLRGRRLLRLSSSCSIRNYR